MVRAPCQLPQTREAVRQSRRGFTLIELMIAIGIIAILTAMLTPMVTGYIDRGRQAVTKDSLVSLAKAMRRFHDDTGSWPLQAAVWNASMAGVQGQFTTADTAMFSMTGLSSLSPCASTKGPLAQPCWGGPYLNLGTSLGDGTMLDAWNNPLHFAYVQPSPTTQAPNGLIVIWSTGPNGVNDTVDPVTSVAHPIAGADDIIQVVGSAL